MKKFKLSLAALALIAMASAFTVKESSVFTDYWVSGDPDSNGDYHVIGTAVSNCEVENVGTVCRISSDVPPVENKISEENADIIGRRQ